MSNAAGSWNRQTSQVDDPLKGYRKRPMISGGGPNTTYLGRVIIEFWEDPNLDDDGKKVAIVVDAVDGKHARLLDRTAKAVTKMLERGNPFEQ